MRFIQMCCTEIHTWKTKKKKLLLERFIASVKDKLIFYFIATLIVLIISIEYFLYIN